MLPGQAHPQGMISVLTDGQVEGGSVRLSQINRFEELTNFMTEQKILFTHYWEWHIKHNLNENEYLIIGKIKKKNWKRPRLISYSWSQWRVKEKKE